MSLYAVAQDGQQSQARALTPASCAGGSVWPLSAQHAATCTGRGSARAAPSSCAAPHHCISLLPFSSRTGKEEGAAPSRSQKGTAAAKEGGWWWWGFGNSTAGGVRQPTATLPTDAEQTAKLHRGWDGALLPPCWSCHTMPPSLPQQQCSWAPLSLPPLPPCWLWSPAGCCGWAACARQKEQTPQRAHGNTNLLFPPCCALKAEENNYKTPGRNHGGGNDACNTRKAQGHTDSQKHGSTKPGPEHSSTHTQQHPQPSARSPTAVHSERNACGAGSSAAARGCAVRRCSLPAAPWLCPPLGSALQRGLRPPPCFVTPWQGCGCASRVCG